MYANHVIILRQLDELSEELGTLSVSGRQIGALAKSLHFSRKALRNVAFSFVVAAVNDANALSGTIRMFQTVVYALTIVMTFFYEMRRIGWLRGGPGRVQVVPSILPPSPDGAKVTRRFGNYTIKSCAAAASTELLSDTARAALLQRADRRASDAGMPRNGVSAEMLRQFASEFMVKDTTTAGDVCERHVKPMTAQTRVPLIAILQAGRDADGAPWCGRPTHFISYAWSYPLLLLLDIIEQFEEEHSAGAGRCNYYFLDQFSLNQHVFVSEHANQKQVQKQIVAALEGEMTRSRHVLMCMHPWSEPVPLTRAWCLFELFVAIEADCKVTMCFGREDSDALYVAIANGHFSPEKAVGDIDAQNAGATKTSDKKLIIDMIAEKVGVDAFNQQMKEYLKAAMRKTVTAVLARGLRPKSSVTRASMRTSTRSGRAADEPLAPVSAAQPTAVEEEGVAGAPAAAAGVAETARVAEGLPFSALALTAGAEAGVVPCVRPNSLASRVDALGAQVNSRMSVLEEQLGTHTSCVSTRMSALEGQLSALGAQVGSRMATLEEQVSTLARAVAQMNDHLAGRAGT
eukprot:g585.t1